MISDGLTKGAVGRELLHKLMDGMCEFKYEFEHWHCKKRIGFRDPQDSDERQSVADTDSAVQSSR